MAGVAVARLRLKAPPDRAALATHRVTDALRLAPAGPERLLLVRKLALGRLPMSARPSAWEARTADLLAEQSAHAVHGAFAGPDSGAVWFRSAAEARALLLRELAAGRRPLAWFWRLAVPEWESLALEAWLPRWIELASRDAAEAVALARAVMAVAQDGDLAPVMSAVPHGAGPVAAQARARRARPRSAYGVTEPEPVPADQSASPAAMRRAAEALARLPSRARVAVEAALKATTYRSPEREWLARQVLLAAAPEIGAAATVLEAAAAALADLAGNGPVQREPPPDRASLLHHTPPHSTPEDRLPIQREAVAASRPRADPLASAAIAAERPDVQAATPRLLPVIEVRSAVAGVLLLVRPLARMGLDDWLAARPDQAADGFGRGLLRAIALRMGARDGDPVLVALAGEDVPEWAGDLTAWRVGLDRWLRRTARIRLAEVVRRPGGLLLTDDMLEVRFAPDAAEVRLRRRAFDLDPNWTPWLGLSIRYHYRDEPLT